MRLFYCDNCRRTVFFENFRCVKCDHTLAYLPELSEIVSLKPAGEGLWTPEAPEAGGRTYRLCENYAEKNVCNWAVPADQEEPLCEACLLTETIPDLAQPGHHEAWYALEVAKRRLVYSLQALGLPVVPKSVDPERGLEFNFLADPPVIDEEHPAVLTGHANGTITVNLAEADDAERESRRVAMHEPYRTLLGHFRHEVGHYYWDRLIKDSGWLAECRAVFGDDQEDYGEALNRHYQNGPRPDWQSQFVSAYASVHAWEDWAETWAHYLHITDTLETATACGLALRPQAPNARRVKPRFSLEKAEHASFDDMMDDWLAMTYVLNSLNRGMGLKDMYPFVLSQPAIEKLRFIHRVCTEPAPAAVAGTVNQLGAAEGASESPGVVSQAQSA
ncbi:zinc-binding metallopeptidase family protein [Lacipirellula sp.]|uniref:zinc-binding metallopeptidase family protein n=1 Tax=Lacipirellula sp. TaxID=2691419 RepID=UPI003D0C11AA